MKQHSLLFFTRKVVLAFLALLLIAQFAFAGGEIKIGKDFNLFTSANLQGWSKPLFTTIEEGFHTNLFTKAVYENYWTIGLDISLPGTLIPNSQRSYDAELPDMYGNTGVAENAEIKDGKKIKNISGKASQPTIYGGEAYGVFSTPQDQSTFSQYYKSVGFVEGNDMSFVPTLPVLQLFCGIPTKTQVRLRFFSFNAGEEAVPVTYYGIMINQQVNHFFGLFEDDPMMGLALHFSYHSLKYGNGLDMSSFAIGAHFSKSWDNGFTAFAGLQYETMSGKLLAIRDGFDSNDVADSPYKEIRDGNNLEFDIESFNSFRLLGGLSYKTGIVELHADAAWASQPVLSVGIALWFAEIGKPPETKIEKIERYERYEKIEKEIIKEKEVIKEKETTKEKEKEEEEPPKVD